MPGSSSACLEIVSMRMSVLCAQRVAASPRWSNLQHTQSLLGRLHCLVVFRAAGVLLAAGTNDADLLASGHSVMSAPALSDAAAPLLSLLLQEQGVLVAGL